MSWTKFGLGFLAVGLLTYAKTRLVDYWVPIEFGHFLIFFVLRSSQIRRALCMTFLVSVGLDFLVQAAHVKGLQVMGQLLLVYLGFNLKKHVIPQYEDVFLLLYFAIFYVGDYYIHWGLSSLLGLPFSRVNPSVFIFTALFHTAFFGLLILITAKLKRGGS